MRNKEILSDPVAAFSALGMTTSQSRITALEELALKARSLKQLCRETRRQTNILSRQIGEARRDGKPVDALRVTMKEHSARLKRVEKQLRDVEDRILEFFDPGPGPRAVPKPLLDPETGNMAPEREYSETAERADRVAISLLKDEADEWNAYVSRNPAATIHHRAEWQQLLKQTYGLESNYFVARDACGNVVGILPLVRLKSRLFGDFMVSMPWFGRGGAVADRPLIERKLMQAANQHASNLGIEHIEYRDDILHEGFPVLKHKVNMVLSLPNSEEALWRGFPSKLRSQIRRSRRENTEILIGSDELVNEFYRVYTRNMRDLGSPAHSKQFVINILQRFPQQSWIIVLRLYNRPIAF